MSYPLPNLLRRALVVSVALLTVAAGCGSESTESGTDLPPCQAVDKPALGEGEVDLVRAPSEIWAPSEPATELVITDIVEGEGSSTGAESTVVVNYVGIQQRDCEEFDSSWERGEPATFSLAGVIPGFAEGLVDMKVGGRRHLVIPADQAYGDDAQEGSPSGTLVFVVDLVSFTQPAAADPAALAAAEARGKPTPTVPDPLPTELTIVDDVVGEGPELAAGGDVAAHYVGVDATGTEFGSTWTSGAPETFSLDQVIPGWTQGLPGMRVGGRRTLIIPSVLAYGDDASSGRPTGTLIFTIDLVGVG